MLVPRSTAGEELLDSPRDQKKPGARNEWQQRKIGARRE
jgi:hypothetical protein